MPGFDEIEARAQADELAANPPDPSEGVEHTEDTKRKHTFRAKYFKVSLSEEQIDQFRLMDPVGKAFYMAGKMRLKSRKELEASEIFSVPEGVFDRNREQLVDAVSAW